MSSLPLSYFYKLIAPNKIASDEIRELILSKDSHRVWKKMGDLLLQSQYNAEAVESFNKFLEFEPSNSEVLANKGKALLNLHKYEEAIGCFTQSLNLDDQNSEVWANKGDSLLGIKEYKEAFDCYDRALKIKAHDPILLCKKANVLVVLGDYDKALKFYKQSIEKDATSPIVWANKGFTLSIKGDYKNAEIHYKKALKLDQNNIAALRNLSSLYSDTLYRYDEALPLAYRLCKISPTLEWKTFLSESLLKVGEYHKVRILSKQILDEGDKIYTCINRLFIIASYYLEANITKANHELINFLENWDTIGVNFKIEETVWVFEGLKNVVRYKTDKEVANILFGLIDLLQGNKNKNELAKLVMDYSLKESLKVIQRTFANIFSRKVKEEGHPSGFLDIVEQLNQKTKSDLRPLQESAKKIESISKMLGIEIDLDIKNQFQLAYLMVVEGKYKEAIPIYERILDKEPNNIKALANKGLSFYRLGKYEEAICLYDRVLNLENDNIEALVNKGLAFRKLHEYEKANRCFYDALQSRQSLDDVDALLNKGIALNQIHEYEKAITYFDRALTMNSTHYRALVNKGISLDKLGKYKDARKCYDEVLMANPKSVLAIYNKSCSYALEGNATESLCWLEKAIALDFHYKNIAKDDPSFEKLWKDEAFIKLVCFVEPGNSVPLRE